MPHGGWHPPVAYVVKAKGFLVNRCGATMRTAYGCDEVDFKTAHARAACAAANLVAAVCVCAAAKRTRNATVANRFFAGPSSVPRANWVLGRIIVRGSSTQRGGQGANAD